MTAPRLTGLFPREMIGTLTFPRLEPRTLDRFRALSDLTSTVSDALDRLGLTGAIPGSILRLTIPGARVVGQVWTVRNERRRPDDTESRRLGDLECHNLAQPGDVLVIQGVEGISSMGAVSATLGMRQGEAGAIVDGAVRDLEHTRKIGYPIWTRGPSPLTGKQRLTTAAINGPVTIAGVRVEPGDLALADETGVCFVAREQVEAVWREMAVLIEREAERMRRIAAGTPIPDLG